jgi:superoxide dismutase, Cu-Zn family
MLALLLPTALLALAGAEPAAAAPTAPPAAAKAALAGPGGAGGTATLREGPLGVLLELELKGLAPGWHAAHFHEKADCSDPKFLSAGGHINHAAPKAPHGLLNPQGPDFGDLPNVHVGADGMAHAQIYSPLVSISGAGGRPALLDADGSAIVIHAKADDYASQPIGGAGDRIACGAVTPARR